MSYDNFLLMFPTDGVLLGRLPYLHISQIYLCWCQLFLTRISLNTLWKLTFTIPTEIFQGLHSASIPGILSLDINPSDHSKLLTGGNDRNATVFNKDTEQVVAILKGHTKKVTRVIYHPDEDTVITASPDHTIRVWNVPTLVTYLTLKLATGSLHVFQRAICHWKSSRKLFGSIKIRMARGKLYFIWYSQFSNHPQMYKNISHDFTVAFVVGFVEVKSTMIGIDVSFSDHRQPASYVLTRAQ